MDSVLHMEVTLFNLLIHIWQALAAVLLISYYMWVWEVFASKRIWRSMLGEHEALLPSQVQAI